MATLGADRAGMSLMRGRRTFESVGASDDVVLAADRLQRTLDEGPCVEAASESRTLYSADVAADERWPRWGPRAAELGVHSVLAVEVHSARGRIGGLNLYASRAHGFSATDVPTVHVFAHHAAAALAAARESDNLRAALDTRTLIGQAQGIPMERFDLDDQQAFGVLRRYSPHANVKLHQVAEDVVERRSLPFEGIECA